MQINRVKPVHTRSLALVKFQKEQGVLFLSRGDELSFLQERAADVAAQLWD